MAHDLDLNQSDPSGKGVLPADNFPIMDGAFGSAAMIRRKGGETIGTGWIDNNDAVIQPEVDGGGFDESVDCNGAIDERVESGILHSPTLDPSVRWENSSYKRQACEPLTIRAHC